MIAIADYGVGNIFSLYRSFEAIGADARLTDDPAVLRRADRLVLPGVGAADQIGRASCRERV